MRDVFISYSRKNLKFVRELTDTLEQAKFDVWVDIEGIYAGEEFWPVLTKAIDNAVAFVFVMSHDSLASKYCNKELDHAIASQKRIVPVCYQDSAGIQIPQALSKRQWVFYRPTDDAKKSLASLASAIRADWRNQRLRTKLYARALEWQEKQQETSLLVRGRELKLGEAWYSRAKDKKDDEFAEHAPTPLHKSFLETSRQATRRRLQIMSGATFAALAIITVVSWLFLDNKVSKLVNLAEGQEVEQMSALAEANDLCGKFRQVFTSCPVAAYSYAVAFLNIGEFLQAADKFTSAIDQLADADQDDDETVTFAGNAHQYRAYTHIMLAEHQEESEHRDQAYERAEKDTQTAKSWYQINQDQRALERLNIVDARIMLGTGEYTLAQEALERADQRVWSPEIDLLLSLVHRCLQDFNKANTYFMKYRESGQLEAAEWKHTNKIYYQSIGKRC